MYNFYNSFKFIISFLILLIFFQMLFGAKFVKYFLMLVLASMVVINHKKVGYLFKGIQEEAK